MIHFAGKTARVLFLAAVSAMLLAATAFAADIAVGVGCINGSSVRMRSDATTSSSIVKVMDKSTVVAILDDSLDGWFKISQDGQDGYVSADYLTEDRDGLFTAYGRVNAEGVNVRTAASTESDVAATLALGTLVTVNGISEDGWYSVTCKYGTQGYIRSDFLDLTKNLTASSGKGADLVATAKQYLGTRYVYGGASSSGFDCSGFTMYVYNKYGVSLPHTATGQWQSGAGSKVSSISGLQLGDLVFFCDPSRSNGKACSHAGIYIGEGKFIHASSSRSGGVVISSLYDDYYNRYFVGGLHVL